MKPLVISFSGGRTSAYMTWLLLRKYKNERDILVVFANTGMEREETLKFVHDCDMNFGFNTVWLEGVQHHGKRKSATYKIVTYKTASRKGEPFEDMIKKHGIPNQVFPHCSRELKKYPINSYIRDVLEWKDYEIALGIRADEPKRLTQKPKVIYPLAHEFPSTKLQVNQWWHKNSFNLELKDYEGNCNMCWKKSKRKLLTLLIEHPEYADWWNRMEVEYGDFVPPTQQAHRVTPITFFRQGESMQELIEDSASPFTKQEDVYTLDQLMFTQPELDFEESGCGKASCEPF
jgi:hypothetical protein